MTYRYDQPPKFDDRIPESRVGFSEQARAFMAVEVDDSTWDELQVSGNWERHGGTWANADGEAVFRKTIAVPADWNGRDLMLRLGKIHALDDVYWNGQQLGRTNVHNSPEGSRALTTQYRDGELVTVVNEDEKRWWMWSRVYTIPAALVRPGRNQLAVRIYNDWADGGFLGAADELRLDPVGITRQPGLYHPDYISEFVLSDCPFRYYRW